MNIYRYLSFFRVSVSVLTPSRFFSINTSALSDARNLTERFQYIFARLRLKSSIIDLLYVMVCLGLDRPDIAVTISQP